jgi:hypothetical protein
VEKCDSLALLIPILNLWYNGVRSREVMVPSGWLETHAWDERERERERKKKHNRAPTGMDRRHSC